MGRSVLGSWIEAVNKYKEFISLVKKMRDAQIEAENCIHEDYDLYVERVYKADRLEREVDEYLKKMGV
jgi:trans-2-enoyl-CoA reductase